MHFLALLLTLHARQPDPFHLPFANGGLASAFLQAIRDKDARLREQRLKAALLRGDQEHITLRITCCDKPGDTVGSIVLQALALGSILQLPGQEYQVESLDLADSRWTGIATWADILSNAPGVRMHFTFATPLVTSHSAGVQSANALPFPHPEMLFASMLHCWRILDGPCLPYSGGQITQMARCVVSEYQLETAGSVHGDHSLPGFLGWIEYACCKRDMTAIASLNALARLAFFTGSGYLTEQGMGATAVRITN
jgi:hypothetical protein